MEALKDIHYIESNLGGADIIVHLALPDFGAALGAGIDVGTGIYPSESKLSLEIPVLVDRPGITVGNTGAGAPSLIAAVGELREVGTEKIERLDADTPHIVLATEGMDAEEVADKALAKPVTCLRLYHPVFPFVLIADCPGIETTLILNPDKTYTLHSVYIDRDSSFDDKGTYTLKGNLLTLKEENGEISYYKVEENRVRLLTDDKQEITGALADHYILNKE